MLCKYIVSATAYYRKHYLLSLAYLLGIMKRDSGFTEVLHIVEHSSLTRDMTLSMMQLRILGSLNMALVNVHQNLNNQNPDTRLNQRYK